MAVKEFDRLQRRWTVHTNLHVASELAAEPSSLIDLKKVSLLRLSSRVPLPLPA